MRKPSDEIKAGVCAAYSAAARSPGGKHPFPVGRGFAEDIGYPREILDTLPNLAVESFAGVSNVSIFAGISPGARVVDIGCGAGLDSLIVAQRVGPSGRVIGVDFSAEMLRRARLAAQEAGIRNVEFRDADASALPIEPASVDVVIVNGIFNLNPDRAGIFRELGRVVRKGGAVYTAELILVAPLPAGAGADESNWFA